jgi:hypothetical protein
LVEGDPWRVFPALALALLLLLVLAPEGQAEGEASIRLIGTQATYVVTSTAVGQATASGHVTIGGVATSSTTRGAAGAQTITIRSRVIAQQQDVLTVRSAVTAGAAIRTGDYRVPLATVLRPIPGQQTPITGGVGFARTTTAALPDGRMVRIAESGRTAGIWFAVVRTVVTIGQQSGGSMRVTLLRDSGGPAAAPPATALWLLPELSTSVAQAASPQHAEDNGSTPSSAPPAPG